MFQREAEKLVDLSWTYKREEIQATRRTLSRPAPVREISVLANLIELEYRLLGYECLSVSTGAGTELR